MSTCMHCRHTIGIAEHDYHWYDKLQPEHCLWCAPSSCWHCERVRATRVEPRWLGIGIYVCGGCGYPVTVNVGGLTRPAAYVCKRRVTHPRVYRNQAHVDTVVIAWIIQRIKDGNPPLPELEVDPPAILPTWKALSLDIQRQVVQATMTVTLLSSVSLGRGFAPESVSITPR